VDEQWGQVVHRRAYGHDAATATATGASRAAATAAWAAG
jgi:hypothetical protein